MYILVMNSIQQVTMLPQNKILSAGLTVVGLGLRENAIVSHHRGQTFFKKRHQLDVEISEVRYIFEDGSLGDLSMTRVSHHETQGNEYVVGAVYQKPDAIDQWEHMILSGILTTRTKIAQYIASMVPELIEKMRLVVQHEQLSKTKDATLFMLEDFAPTAQTGDSVLVSIPGEKYQKVATLEAFDDISITVVYQGNCYKTPRQGAKSLISQ